MKLGDRLKELLEQQDMTQKKLAQELDITPAALGNYIRNVREPDYNTLIRIADYFHVSIDFLLNLLQFCIYNISSKYCIL